MKSSPTSVPIIRPQSDNSKRQQSQKKLNLIKVQAQSKSPAQKKITDQDNTKLTEAEENETRRKTDDYYTKMKSRQAAESSASKKKSDSENKAKKSRIKPKIDIISHTKISTETRIESKASINKESPYKRKTNLEFNHETKSEKPKINTRINPKAKESEAFKPKPRVKPPNKNDNESKIPIRTKVKNFNSPNIVKQEKTKANDKPIKKEVTKPKNNNNNNLIQKDHKKVETVLPPKKSSQLNFNQNKKKTKKEEIEEDEEDEEEEEEEEGDDDEEEEIINAFELYKNKQKETLLSKYLQNQNSENKTTTSIIDDEEKNKKENNFELKNEVKSNTNNQSSNQKTLKNLTDSEGENQIQYLDEIIEEVQNWKSDYLNINFNAYIELTEKIYKGIKTKKFSSDVALFKASAIIAKIAPLSDKELLTVSLSTLMKMSMNSENSTLFIECHLVEPLLKICFGEREIDEMSKSSAKILSNIINNKQIMYEMLQLEAMTMECKEIASHSRRGKFSIEYSYYLNDILTILAVLCEKTSDFSKYIKYSLPTNLLTILKLYRNDNSIQNKVSEIFKILLDFDENVEQLECEDLSPLFVLLDSSNQSTIENAVYAISNAISISDFFVDTIAELEPPLGIVSLCNKLKNDLSNPINAELLKCLIKLTSFRQGAEMAVQSFNKVSAFMDFEPYELMGIENGQTAIVSALQILKNLAYIVPDRVAAAVNGKLKFFCQIGAISVVIEIAKILIKTDNGRKALEEVKDIPQISSMF